MAESVVFGLASKILSAVASPAIEKAYQKGCSVWEAKDELEKLRATVGTIRAVLLDAERKQEHSEGVRDWIKRVKGVLYYADDLFDGAATDDMLKQQLKIKGNKFLYKVRVSCSMSLNPIISSNSIAQKVKEIRKSLDEISRDMSQFGFIRCDQEEPIHGGMRIGQDPGSFVDQKNVFGRDEDKKIILDILLNDESENAEIDIPLTIAIVGIGGMGKTTLAQLVYNDEEVKKKFEGRWFACISDTLDDKVITGKIFQSMCGGTYGDLALDRLQSGIRESIAGKKFLLVLDDVWDEDHGRWQNQRSLLSGGAKGSMLIVTTRSSAVARAADALRTHPLRGLSEEDSWNLFKRVAFTFEQERDSRWTSIGKEIVKKCANVPLAIKSIGTLLYTKTTMQEWETFAKEDLSKLGRQNGDVSIMSILKLSYDHLSSNMKQCFAYCSLFPKDCMLHKNKLIYLWIAQGYIESDNATHTIEEVGHLYFMDLLRRSFFQPMEDYEQYYQMHDLIHDLAQHVAGEESSMFTKSSSKEDARVKRHVSVEKGIDDSLGAAIINADSVNHLRSFIFTGGYSAACKPTIIEECVNLKYLRTLSLPRVGIENVSTSIGELKHLRYLDISGNGFKNLPDSITKLLNLCTLNISYCQELEALPADFRKLVNLKHLINLYCFRLKCMPPGFKELISLQRLDMFKVGGTERNQLNALEEMRLGGELRIHFKNYMNDEWEGVECWKPPVNLQELTIYDYEGTKIPRWGNGSRVSPNQLTVLRLYKCLGVKCLPPLFFRHLPNLSSLFLYKLDELEYIEDDDDGATDSDVLFLPPLKELEIVDLSKLKGWWGTRNEQGHSSSTSHQLLPSFLSLSRLKVCSCEEMEWMPLCPCLERLTVTNVNTKLISQFLSTSSPSLKHVDVEFLDAQQCILILKVVVWANLSNIKYFRIEGYGVLFSRDYNDVGWDSLRNRITLILERLPNSIRNRQANDRIYESVLTPWTPTFREAL